MSKVPFYVVGGCFAAWAVVVAFLGFSRPDFPGGTATTRLVMAVSALLAVGAITTAILGG